MTSPFPQTLAYLNQTVVGDALGHPGIQKNPSCFRLVRWHGIKTGNRLYWPKWNRHKRRAGS